MHIDQDLLKKKITVLAEMTLLGILFHTSTVLYENVYLCNFSCGLFVFCIFSLNFLHCLSFGIIVINRGHIFLL